jgi:hypothetical protein
MQSLSCQFLADVSGGKEVPGYGKPGGIPAPTTPSPKGGGNLQAIIIGIIGSAVWDAAKGVWETRTTGSTPPEEVKSPEENNSDSTSLGLSGGSGGNGYGDYDGYGDNPWRNESSPYSV